MLETILSRENMLQAYRAVERNGGSGGVDGVEMVDFKAHLQAIWPSVREALLSGCYTPSPVKRVTIPKPGGGNRHLGIPTLLDRIIQQAIHQVLSPQLDSHFSGSSYGFRRGRNAHQAVHQAQSYLNAGYSYVVDIDLKDFFDTVNHDRLMARLSQHVNDKRVLKLIRRYLQSGVLIGGAHYEQTKKGTPQGGPLSPLLANLVLDELDKELESRGHCFIRYADDVSIYVRSTKAGERVLTSVKRFLESRLRLTVNTTKSGVRRPSQFVLLGFSFYAGRSGYHVRIAAKSYKRLGASIRKLTARSWSISTEERITRLNQFIQGWVGYFRIADAKGQLKALDAWTRRRIRMSIWKQWKRVRTRYRQLVRLDISPWRAYQWANTRKGYWSVAGSKILSLALPNDKLTEMGYIGLVTTYTRLRQV